MITLHPEYDHCWFVKHPETGRIVQAPTIRALLEKFGPGYKIRDYCPDGNTPIKKAKPPRFYSEKTLVAAAKAKARNEVIGE